MKNFTSFVKGKKVLVFGLGLQGGGVGDALYLHEKGAIVHITDLKSKKELSSSLAKLPPQITLTLGGHEDSDIEWADLVIKNPGVPDSVPQLALAQKLRKSVYTSIALVIEAASDQVIGITGTRGKSTTTELIYQALSQAFPGQVIKGGNVPGTSGLSLLEEIKTHKYLVLELSSFQLAGLHALQVSPKYAVLTNIYPDHLNRYPDMQAYKYDKTAIFAYQTSQDLLFVNGDNREVLQLVKHAPSKQIVFRKEDLPSSWQLQLPGEHNRENVAALLSLAKQLALPVDPLRHLVENFRGLPFRLELIREFQGVKYYNDTTSTTPTATIKAIEALPGPLVLIIGGPSKNLPFDKLVSLLRDSPKVTILVLLGGDSNKDFLQALHTHCEAKLGAHAHSMPEAVRAAWKLAQPGSTVLLSPGFFSFDLFENEFDRGRQFNQAVKKL